MTDEVDQTADGTFEETSVEGEELDALGDEPVTEESDAQAYIEELKAANEELQKELAATLKEKAQAEAEADEYRPWEDVSHFHMENRDDVFARFGREQIVDLAQTERVKQNRERSKNGHFPLPPLEGEELERAIEATVADLLGDEGRAQPPVEGPLNRVLKMVDKQGGLRQIPYEPQVNNMAGSLADGYERYRQKGFKMPKPMMCATQDCYKDSAQNEAGEFAFGGYCSADHRDRTERTQTQTGIPGVTNRNVLTGV